MLPQVRAGSLYKYQPTSTNASLTKHPAPSRVAEYRVFSIANDCKPAGWRQRAALIVIMEKTGLHGPFRRKSVLTRRLQSFKIPRELAPKCNAVGAVTCPIPSVRSLLSSSELARSCWLSPICLGHLSLQATG
jgi:hypothetical protein